MFYTRRYFPGSEITVSGGINPDELPDDVAELKSLVVRYADAAEKAKAAVEGRRFNFDPRNPPTIAEVYKR